MFFGFLKKKIVVISILTQIIVIMIFFHNRSTLLIVVFRTETLSFNPVLHQRNRPWMISETVNQQDPSNRCFSQLPNFPYADGCSLSICARPECWMRPNWCNEAISLRSWAALLSKQEQGCRVSWSHLLKCSGEEHCCVYNPGCWQACTRMIAS